MNLHKILVSAFILLAISAPEARPVTISTHPYQLGSEVGGGLEVSGTVGVNIHCKAVKKEGVSEYLYLYAIENTRKDYFLFQFDLLNYVLSGRYNFRNVFEMPAGKIYTFTLTSSEPPVLASGHASVFRKDLSLGHKKYLQDLGVTTPTHDFWVFSLGGDLECPLPPSLLKPL